MRYNAQPSKPIGSGGWIWFAIASVGGICAGIRELTRLHPAQWVPVAVAAGFLLLIVFGVLMSSPAGQPETKRAEPVPLPQPLWPDLRGSDEPQRESWQ